MTRVRLPPDPTTHCVTTLVDSQHGDAGLVQWLTNRQWQEQQQSLQHQQQQQRRGSGSLFTSTSTNSLQAFWEASSAAANTSSGNATVQAPAAHTDPTAVPMEAASLAEQVDSIILVYDLDRVETFFRIESHWLPLLERCYHGKVSEGRTVCRHTNIHHLHVYSIHPCMRSCMHACIQ